MLAVVTSGLADATPEKVVATVAIALVAGFVMGARYFARRVERGCLECTHCAAEVVRREREAEEKRLRDAEDNLRHLGLTQEQIDDWKRKNGRGP